MAKNTIQIDVQASTKKASAELKKLQSQADAMGKLKSFGSGLQGITGSLPGIDSLTGLMKGGLGGAAVGGASIGLFAKGLGDIASRGQEAAQTAEKLNTSLTKLSRNFGGTGAGVQAVTKELQLMSANGVNSMEDITAAMQTLAVATKGDIVRAGELVKSFDDIAAGTGMTIAGMAEMTAKIMETGVEQRDLNKLARQGIPIYEALGSAMGITADEAKSVAKEGKLGIDEWNKAVDELGKKYAGLSAAMSSQTLQGAQNTYAAMRSMQNQSAAEARNQEMINGLNKLSAAMEEYLNDPDKQARLQMEGKLAGSIDLLTMRLKEFATDLPATFASMMVGVGDLLVPGAAANRRKYLEESAAFLPNLAGDKANLESFNVGKTAADISGLLKETEAALKMFPENARLLEQASNLQMALAMKQEEEAKAKSEADKAEAEEAARKAGADAADAYSKMLLEEAKKSGNAEAILKAYFGEDTLKGTVAEYIAGIKPLENMLKSGLGTPEMIEQLNMLKSVQEAYNKQLKAEADEKMKAAERNAELNKLYTEGKADAARELKSAQEEYDKVSASYAEKMQENAFKQSMIDHGQLPKETYNKLLMETSDTSMVRMEESMRKAQDNLAEANERFANFDKNWQESLDMTRRITNGMTKNTFRVSGTFLAG